MKIFYKEILGTICFTGFLFSAFGQVKTKTFEKGIPKDFLPLKSLISKIKILSPSEEFYKLKEESERSSNKVKRSIAKLMMNALYGKTLQKAIFARTNIVNNIFEFNRFLINKQIISIGLF